MSFLELIAKRPSIRLGLLFSIATVSLDLTRESILWAGESAPTVSPSTSPAISPAIAPAKLSANHEPLVYEKDIRPILKANCFHCHGEEPELKGGLDVRLVRLMTQGGDSGTSIVNGSPDESLLWQRIESDEMPVGAHKLTQDQKSKIRTWIEQGSPTARPEPDDPADARFTEEELSYWAFRPPVKQAVPQVEYPDPLGPIDSFLMSKLHEKGLAFSAEADKSTLLRRLKIDLLGLPPTREELDEFLADNRPEAYDRFVDKYLDSPHYGERWGRHWLDTAGFAESDGNTGVDLVRDHAWRYRDYVINSMNANKPYDQFLLEQLAGDELIDGPVDPSNPRHIELTTATGFLRMAPDVTQTDNSIVDRNQAVADSLKVVSSTILGLTVGCAQCHDHRYDPISIDDYYQFRAIFDPIFPLHAWKQPRDRLADLTTSEVNKQRDEIEAIAAEREKGILERRREAAQRILDLRINEVAEDLRSAVSAAIQLPADQQSEEQKKLLADHPRVKTLDTIIGQFIEFDKVFEMKNYQQYEKEKSELAAFRATKPLKHYTMSVRENNDSLPKSSVMFRGNPEQPTKEVEPAEIFVLTRHRPVDSVGFAPPNANSTTKRRLRYAQILTSPEHPTVSRVAVNRIWQHHFGKGLVATPSDFGTAGSKPTHPELLDYLAVDFVENGWDVKRLHKAIVTSKAFKQNSRRTDDLQAIDPENELYARFSMQRMDAETIRDAILFASNKLVTEVGGPSVPVTDNGTGLITIGKRTVTEGLPAQVSDGGEDKYRRSIYIQVRRSKPLSILEAFDMPVMNPNCEVRRSSTVAPQALMFLNDATILDSANNLAESLQSISQDSSEQIDELFTRLFSRRPTDEEKQECVAFVTAQNELFATEPDTASKRSLASLCQVLLASNRFLYVE